MHIGELGKKLEGRHDRALGLKVLADFGADNAGLVDRRAVGAMAFDANLRVAVFDAAASVGVALDVVVALVIVTVDTLAMGLSRRCGRSTDGPLAPTSSTLPNVPAVVS